MSCLQRNLQQQKLERQSRPVEEGLLARLIYNSRNQKDSLDFLYQWNLSDNLQQQKLERQSRHGGGLFRDYLSTTVEIRKIVQTPLQINGIQNQSTTVEIRKIVQTPYCGRAERRIYNSRNQKDSLDNRLELRRQDDLQQQKLERQSRPVSLFARNVHLQQQKLGKQSRLFQCKGTIKFFYYPTNIKMSMITFLPHPTLPKVPIVRSNPHIINLLDKQNVPHNL